MQNIVCRSKLVDKLHFLTAQTYGEYDMSQFTVTLEYKLPISKEYHTETLKLSDALYKDEWLEYVLPFDTALTKEAGEIEILITFTAAVANEETGEITQYVRKIERPLSRLLRFRTGQTLFQTLHSPLLTSVSLRFRQWQIILTRPLFSLTTRRLTTLLWTITKLSDIQRQQDW